ncbi:hypothetical protein [Waddlia chondrophila]|uniref:Uncharacterized protein n=1 Tax=Waddlia chondrophila (strain ATCC VR-1470 / WSU 86-1044) TaxID=716544 RepID=D6YU47_WADCW|nr:hypothetical protein [Waddlia chondrophila]ADI37658.1 hypothetical protein wcw_0283 [Waddlia chondrophila WSU 86-1044]
MTATLESSPNSINLEAAYEKIKTPLHAIYGCKIISWKDETNAIGRRIVCGFALAGLAVAGIIDIIAGIALGILSSPAELLGYQYSRHFFLRTYYGGMTSLTFLTIFQYENVVGSTLK